MRLAGDRAAAATTAIFQILATAPERERRKAVEGYLRDELRDAAQQAVNEIRLDELDEPAGGLLPGMPLTRKE